MKRTWKGRLLFLGELLFIAVLPLVIVFLGYGSWEPEAKKFKIGFGIIIVAIIIFWIAKRVWINPWLKKMNTKAANLEAMLEAENDTGKIDNIEESLRKVRFTETLMNWILPAAALIALFMASRALERSIVKFSGIIGFIAISEFVGCCFSLLRALSVESKRRKK